VTSYVIGSPRSDGKCATPKTARNLRDAAKHNLGSARGSRVGAGVLARANFSRGIRTP